MAGDGAGNARMEAEPTGVPRMENSPGEEVGDLPRNPKRNREKARNRKAQ